MAEIANKINPQGRGSPAAVEARYVTHNSACQSYRYKFLLVLKIEIDRSIWALGSGFAGGGRF